jgi:hypothetical protein
MFSKVELVRDIFPVMQSLLSVDPSRRMTMEALKAII